MFAAALTPVSAATTAGDGAYSPVINKGSNPESLPTDQDGKARAIGVIDIGAVEVA